MKKAGVMILRKLSKISLRARLGLAVMSVMCSYLFLLYQAHDHMGLLQSGTRGEMKEINTIVARLEKEEAQIEEVVADLEKQSIQLPPAETSISVISNDIAIPTTPTPIIQEKQLPQAPTKLLISTAPENLLPEPITFNSPYSNKALSTLVVCGTDGSGTRRVVDVLTELGVLMVSEDPETFDIHADLMGGWPPIVKPLVRITRSLAYNPAELAQSQPNLHRQVSDALSRLVAQAAADSHKPTSYRLAVGGALPRSPLYTVSRVKFGFKAPVAMTLTPYWAQLMPHFKLLHVVRDGRDIAFSSNQGPVEKFYSDMYHNEQQEKLPPALQAIRLWSDWNSQVLRWSQSYAASPDLSSNSERSFGYLALHSEDLVSASVEQRFNAIRSLAKWVGSNITETKICCLALEDAEYLGSHDRMSRNEVVDANKHVSSKYGKWRAFVARDKSLAQRLNQLGKAGLEDLGYEPLRRLAMPGAVSTSGFVCSREKVECPRCPRQLTRGVDCDGGKKPQFNHTDYAVQGVCSTVANTDYKGDGNSDLETINWDPKVPFNPQSCCHLCRGRQECRSFTINTVQRVCFLKRSKGRVISNSKTRMLVSGDML